MKKVLFFAAVLAVASMTFVACGKKENKENKETEQEGVEQNEEFAGEEAIEAATSLQEFYAIASQYEDLDEKDFTAEQAARVEAVYQKFANK